jgi:hypothetical protein
MPGFFTQNRHYGANFGARHPVLLRLGSVARWVWWMAFGWPLFAAGFFTLLALYVAVPAGWLIPAAPWSHGWDGLVAIIRWWPGGKAGAALAGGLAAALGGFKVWVDYRVDFPWVRFLATAALVGLPVLSIVYTTRLVGIAVVAVLVALVVVLLVVDVVVGLVSRQWRLRRLYAELRREFPAHWADLAARSERIQSFDNRVERTVAESAIDRPILEHPALGPVWQTRFDYAGMAVEVPIARPEGRSFEALEAVLDEWAAQFFTVADTPDAIRLIWPDHDTYSNFASRIFVRIEFKPSRWMTSESHNPQPWPPTLMAVEDSGDGHVADSWLDDDTDGWEGAA